MAEKPPSTNFELRGSVPADPYQRQERSKEEQALHLQKTAHVREEYRQKIDDHRKRAGIPSLVNPLAKPKSN